MLYFGYQTNADLLAPLLNAARLGQASLGWVNGKAEHAMFRRMAASLELVSRFQLTHERPAYGITRVKAGNQDVAVREEAAMKTPFGTLLHFRKEMEAPGPKVLVVAPALRPFRDAAAQYRRNAAAGPRRLHHRLGQRARHTGFGRRLRL